MNFDDELGELIPPVSDAPSRESLSADADHPAEKSTSKTRLVNVRTSPFRCRTAKTLSTVALKRVQKSALTAEPIGSLGLLSRKAGH